MDLPKTTVFNKRIPKQKFYDNITLSPLLKRAFVDQIKAIYWKYKIAPTTMNLEAGDMVTEIEIFELKLSESKLDESVLRQIDKEVPYHIVFLLEFDGKYQAWTAYKEASTNGNNALKVGNYYHTEWMYENELPLKADGLNIDKVYENYVRQIAGHKLKSDKQESLKESVDKDNRRQELQRRISALKLKVRNEKQLNKQVQLNTELKKLKKELEDL